VSIVFVDRNHPIELVEVVQHSCWLLAGRRTTAGLQLVRSCRNRQQQVLVHCCSWVLVVQEQPTVQHCCSLLQELKQLVLLLDWEPPLVLPPQKQPVPPVLGCCS
jgi:hypothetical protein